ncbi:membrane fusion protein, multidrug efflux system [Filimonas lacunae]|uniref:Membrane fusion protein, multidrug efflux system n=1 Tax=Filimonas lacunae TaxID=477680 RepID=A0A173MAM3_9BACT|nr:HlyD family secretion protein [Filimonas lacunae]BAV04586.1 membrane fusion component of tripartite multidrug resistance system [Filimonas lacunae]SIT32747.1 membrane fusion protein, multidrug efflux system [Filimonas lacunae]
MKKNNTLFHHILTVLATLLVIAGIGTGIYFFVFYHNHEQTNDAQVDQYVTPVMSRITGYVQEVKYEENQFVHKGDTLVIIDDREFKTRLSLAQADLEAAEQTVDVLHKGAQAISTNTSIKKAQIDAAKAELWKHTQDYKRYENLLKEEAVTEQQYEQVKASYEAAQAHYNELVSGLQAASLGTEEATSRVIPAASSVKAKQAAVDNAALFVSYTAITAPYDGYTGRKTIQPGQLVKEGQTLVSVVSQEKWITANFKETQVQKLSIGQPVSMKADATGDVIIHGKIQSLSPASGARFSLLPPDNATGNFVKIEQRIPVRIELIDNDSITRFLRAGMNIVVTAKKE